MSLMFAFEIPEPIWNALIAGGVTVALAWIGKRREVRQDGKLEIVAEAAKKAAATGEKTHTLVNSNMGVQLRLNAENSAFRAETTKLPKDIEAAELAAKMLADHDSKQRQVDAGQTGRADEK